MIKYVKIYGIIEYLVLITKENPVSFSAVLGVYIVTGFFLITIALFNVLVDLHYLAGVGAYAFVLVGCPALITTCGQDIFNMNPCDLNI